MCWCFTIQTVVHQGNRITPSNCGQGNRNISDRNLLFDLVRIEASWQKITGGSDWLGAEWWGRFTPLRSIEASAVQGCLSLQGWRERERERAGVARWDHLDWCQSDLPEHLQQPATVIYQQSTAQLISGFHPPDALGIAFIFGCLFKTRQSLSYKVWNE